MKLEELPVYDFDVTVFADAYVIKKVSDGIFYRLALSHPEQGKRVAIVKHYQQTRRSTGSETNRDLLVRDFRDRQELSSSPLSEYTPQPFCVLKGTTRDTWALVFPNRPARPLVKFQGKKILNPDTVNRFEKKLFITRRTCGFAPTFETILPENLMFGRQNIPGMGIFYFLQAQIRYDGTRGYETKVSTTMKMLKRDYMRLQPTLFSALTNPNPEFP